MPTSALWQWILQTYDLGEQHRDLIVNSTVIFYRPLSVLVFFLALWSINVQYFDQKRINYALVLGLQKGSPNFVLQMTFGDSCARLLFR
jgi:hypothetical protein